MNNITLNYIYIVSEINVGEICYIPITESHFNAWLYPWQFPGNQSNIYVKGVFREHKKGAQTIIVGSDDFDRQEFSVNANWINKWGLITQQNSEMFIVTNDDITEYYYGRTPIPSRILCSNSSQIDTVSSRKSRTLVPSVSFSYSTTASSCSILPFDENEADEKAEDSDDNDDKSISGGSDDEMTLSEILDLPFAENFDMPLPNQDDLDLKFKLGTGSHRTEAEFDGNPPRGNRDDINFGRFIDKSPGQIWEDYTSDLNKWVIRCTNINARRLGKRELTESLPIQMN